MTSHSMFSFLKIVELTCKKLGLIDGQKSLRLNSQKAKFFVWYQILYRGIFQKEKVEIWIKIILAKFHLHTVISNVHLSLIKGECL